MNDNDLRLQTYIIKKYNDAMFISDNIEEIISCTDKELFLDKIYLSELLFKLNELEKDQIYPSYAINNIGKVINYIKQNINREDELLEKIIEKYNIVNKLEPSDGIFIKECAYKFGSIKNYNKSFDIYELQVSILYNYRTIKMLINKNEEIKQDDNYVYSIKKILMEFPEIFLDKNINNRSLEILNKNINVEGVSKLINKIKNINKYNQLDFDLINFKNMYYYILIQNMMVTGKNIDIKKYKKDLGFIIKYIYAIIDNNLIYNYKCKENVLNTMLNIREYKQENSTENEFIKFLVDYNDHIGKLNIIKFSYENFFYYEHDFRTRNIARLKYLFKPLNDNLITNDLEILDMYLLSEEEYNEKKNQYKDNKELYLSINKFISLCPSMFDDETIYSRTLEILGNKSKNKIISKRIKKDYKY